MSENAAANKKPSPEPEVFDAVRPPKEFHVRQGESVRVYRVCEMTDEDMGAWMDGGVDRVRTNSKGKVLKTDFTGMHTQLISLCLRDADNKRVPKGVIASWGFHLKSKLYAACQEMNGLDRDAEEDERKN